ncbi:Crp/Fnr family transcriptional regulator [Sutterella sp.]|uniref:Crp/Fnr family transcriptional regulator n=1 Tax=Sutterella sp. TaxID=1981025 RepID=UPI0026DEADA7|nr:Crp/Fnr family transcriptional regulator [Sutterella sp.]MDO5532644.1 Crp/Fnr family transcriptional regulator [Sutterella sp.]
MLLPRYLFTGDFEKLRPELLQIPFRVRRFEPGEFLWQAGDGLNHPHLIDGGLAKCTVADDTGRRRCISWHGPGTIFPVYHRNDFEIEQSITLEAVTEVTSLEFSRADHIALAARNPEFALTTIDWYSKYVNLLLYTASHVALGSVTASLASVLMLLFRNAPDAALADSTELRVTQTELAELLGVDRASLVRALGALRSAGAVATRRGVIELTDAVALSRLSESV